MASGCFARFSTWRSAAKQRLLEFVSRTARVNLDPEALTLGFARRAARYKRGELLVREIRPEA